MREDFRKSPRVSKKEVQSLLTEINANAFGVKISYPLPKQSVMVFIVYKDNKFCETKKFGYPKQAKKFLMSVMNGVYLNETNDI